MVPRRMPAPHLSIAGLASGQQIANAVLQELGVDPRASGLRGFRPRIATELGTTEMSSCITVGGVCATWHSAAERGPTPLGHLGV